MAETVTRQEAIEFLNGLRERRSDQGDAVREVGGYVGDYSDYDGVDAYGFDFKGVRYESWHEASDARGAELAIKTLFDISEDELDD